MKPSHLAIALVAVLGSAACNAEKANESAATSNSAPAQQVKPPANGDWSTVVTQTPEGGFLMGNPNASVKLVEIASMTCPHCAEFDQTGSRPLIDKYVKTGKVAFELRNYVRDQVDMTASLIARCGGTKQFFPLAHQMFASQRDWFGKIQQAPEAQLQAVGSLPPTQQFVEIAKLSGLQQWAAQRGLPSAKSGACLTNENEINRLVEMNGAVVEQYPDFRGTPSFVLNGKLLENVATWELLEPQLQSALGERG